MFMHLDFVDESLHVYVIYLIKIYFTLQIYIIPIVYLSKFNYNKGKV